MSAAGQVNLSGSVTELSDLVDELRLQQINQIAGSVDEIMENPVSLGNEGSLICDISRLGIHLIQPQNYSQYDVTELTAFLNKQIYPTPTRDFWCRDITVPLNNYTVNDVTVQAAVCYINSKELMMEDRPHLLRMMLHCLRRENRVRLLHYEYGYLSDHDQTSTSSCLGSLNVL